MVKMCRRDLLNRRRERLTLVSLSFDYGYNTAARLSGTSRHRARYWTRKFIDPTYHPHKIGTSHRKIKKYEKPIAFEVVLLSLLENPVSKLNEIALYLGTFFNRRISRSVCSRLLQEMGWSWKIPTKFQIQKYTVENMEIYVDYITTVPLIDWNRLKFLDEGHFVSRQLDNGKLLWLSGSRNYKCSTSLN